MEVGTWKLEVGGVQLEFGNWNVYVVIRELEATGGSWMMTVRWKLEVGKWKLEDGS